MIYLMTELDEKIRDVFTEESIYKTSTRYNMFAGVNVPSFIKDWLIKRYSNENEEVDKEALFAFLEKHIPGKDSDIKSRLIKGESIQILVRVIVESDLKTGIFKFSIPDIGIKNNEGLISANDGVYTVNLSTLTPQYKLTSVSAVNTGDMVIAGNYVYILQSNGAKIIAADNYSFVKG